MDTRIRTCLSLAFLLLGFCCLVWEPAIAQIQWHGVDTLDVADFSSNDVRVSIDRSGIIFAAWVVPPLISPESLFTAEYTPASGWTPKTLFNTGAERVFHLTLDVSDNGNGTMAWSGHNGLFASIRTPGSGWQSRRAVDSGSSPFLNFANHPQVKMDSAGSGLLLWGNDDDSKLLSSRHSPGTNLWTAPEIITTERTGSAFSFDRGAHGDGMVLWDRGGVNIPNTTLFASHSVGGQGLFSEWQPPDSLYTSSPKFHASSVAVNSRGDAVAAWVEILSAVYAARFIHNQGWQSDEILSMDFNGSMPTQAGIDSSGDAVVLWVNVFDKGIYAHRYIPGSGWQPRDTILTPGLSRGDPILLPPHMDENGNILVMFLSRDYFLQAKQYISGAGWQQIETLSFVGTVGQVYLATFRVNATGEGVLIWEEEVGGRVNFYTSRFSVGSTMGLSTEKVVPHEFWLSQNYPNPFNPLTTITFSIPRSEFVTLRVYDILGREVTTLLHGRLSPGTYAKEWNATDVASGVYFYRLQTGTYVETKKLLLLR